MYFFFKRPNMVLTSGGPCGCHHLLYTAFLHGPSGKKIIENCTLKANNSSGQMSNSKNFKCKCFALHTF